MILRKLIRYLLLAVSWIVAFVLVFLLFAVGPVDRTPVEDLESYEVMMQRLDTLRVDPPHPSQKFSVGYGRVNLTPSSPVATAGYGKRQGKPYTHVHDSVYVRSLVIDNGAERVAIVSADLLIMPPTVTEALQSKLRTIGFSLDNTYLGATHSHNSIGHWGTGAARLIYGAYEDSVVHFIADAVVASILQATRNLMPANLRAGAIALPDAVENRLIDGGNEDPWLRVIEVHRTDSMKLVLLTYAAHATCLSQGTIELSRDYPGELVARLEAADYAFAMFMAGAVGSHRGSSPVDDFECTAWMAEEIASGFLEERATLRPVEDTTLTMARVPITLSDPQVKIARDWKVRSWLFRAALGEYDAFLTALRVGDVVLLGTPCDFSGEFHRSLDSLGTAVGLQPVVTSFNGGYIGYLTPREYYDIDHYETRLMNWYAPGTGDMVNESLKRLMTVVSDSR